MSDEQRQAADEQRQAANVIAQAIQYARPTRMSDRDAFALAALGGMRLSVSTPEGAAAAAKAAYLLADAMLAERVGPEQDAVVNPMVLP